MTEVMTQAFWATATAAVQLIIPIIVIMIFFRIVTSVLFDKR